LTFLGEPRTDAARHAQETHWTMTLPLVVLSIFSVAAGWIGIPKAFPGLGGLIPNWFEDFVNGTLLGNAPSYEGHSLVPLLTSLVVALGGLYIGWLVYRRLPKNGTDPLQNALGIVYTVLKNKYYFDELYHVLFVVPSLWLAETFIAVWVDRGIIDGVLHGIAKVTLWVGSSFRKFFDVPVVNGTGDAIGKGVRLFGFSLKPIQTGRVQQYMITVFVVALIAFVFLFLRGVGTLALK